MKKKQRKGGIQSFRFNLFKFAFNQQPTLGGGVKAPHNLRSSIRIPYNLYDIKIKKNKKKIVFY